MGVESLISIIIPMYNAQDHLRECLDSIVNQTYSSLEIICVNDGSTDSTGEILQSYSQKDSRIVVINQENQGPLSARNNGIKAMTGSYLFFIDSDDYLEPNAIELLHNQMVKDNTQIAFSNFVVGNKTNYGFTQSLLCTDEVLTSVLNCNAKMFPCWGMLIGNCFVDNEFKNYRLCEDELYAFDLFVDTDKASYISQTLITYRNKGKRVKKLQDFDYYYQGFMAAQDLYKMVTVDRPHLMQNAKCRLLMHTMYCYFCACQVNCPKDKLYEMKSTIKANRQAVISNSQASNTVKMALFLTYFGMWLPTNLFKLYTSVRK